MFVSSYPMWRAWWNVGAVDAGRRRKESGNGSECGHESRYMAEAPDRCMTCNLKHEQSALHSSRRKRRNLYIQQDLHPPNDPTVPVHCGKPHKIRDRRYPWSLTFSFGVRGDNLFGSVSGSRFVRHAPALCILE